LNITSDADEDCGELMRTTQLFRSEFWHLGTLLWAEKLISAIKSETRNRRRVAKVKPLLLDKLDD